MINPKYISIICLFFFSIHSYTQSNDVEEWIESILSNADEEADLDLNTLLEQIESYRDRPLRLNKASRGELESLSFLTDLEIEAILQHRRKYGDFINILELQSVTSLPLQKAKLLSELAVVNLSMSKQLDQGILRDQQHELYIKWRRVLEEQKGYSEDASSPYLGDPNKLYLRYKYKAGKKVQIGFTAEKDAGEEFFSGSNKQGFDFYSGHIAINESNRFFKQIIIGDYSINMGQGLVASMGFGTGKSSRVMSVKSRNKDLKPYTSVNEFNFLRGLATKSNLSEKLQLNTFISFQKRDANFFLDTISEDIFRLYTSVPINGFHRNENEIRKEKQIGFFDTGMSLKYKLDKLKINANLLYSSFNADFDTNPKLYQLFSALQREYLNGSIDYSYIWRNFSLFGEFASDKEGDLAFLNGLILGLDKNLEVAIVYRNISRSYQSIYSNSFTESSSAVNEEGIYMSALLRFSKQLELQGYMDLFRHPWLRFRIDSPSSGNEYYLKLLYKVKRKSDSYIQYFYEQKEQNLSNSGFKSTPIVPTFRNRLRFHNSYKVTPSFEIRNRVEFSWYQKDNLNSKGFMAFQDLILKPKNIPMSATFRYAIFDTDNYDSRIYAYENDLLYEFSIPSYFNRGFRTYLNLRYRINRNLTAEARISRTYLNNEDSIGSALDEINGNKRTDVKAQLRFKF